MNARQDGVLNRRWQVLATRSHHLRDEEGVATRLAVERVGVDAGLRRKLGYRRGGQQRHFDPAHDRLRGDIAEHHAQRVGRTQVLVPVRRDHEGVRALETSREEPHEVERRTVGPVQVFDHQHGGPGSLKRR